ncbi:peptidoglycan bridge formation glycyltransferase FemA/FemB family protein [Candidatus Giovannonibacteria bacterium]|nr:peptidoglycan bridge formation glycyltransferase FemA/FemB family protein [Candidatus Giovannonibacteria bacterium]
MDIHPINEVGKENWNAFVAKHYPPVGAFMQTWEWGEFQKALGRKIERYVMEADSGEHIAVFTVVYHSLPFGFSYGYSPRGPVISKHLDGDAINKVFQKIALWTKQNFKDIIFLRLEPPLTSAIRGLRDSEFRQPAYYIQPRHNLFVSLAQTENEILESFHPSTRSNIKRALRRGVRDQVKHALSGSELKEFYLMTEDTIKRNSGKNVYPHRHYFETLIRTIPKIGEKANPDKLELGIRYAYQNEKAAAAEFTVFFGNTATYLYGASFSERLSSKATTFLHWAEILEAKRRGFLYYDFGGIDETIWPTLTNFKRQFRGAELSYIGNVDIPLKPKMYQAYNFFRRAAKLK